MLAKIVRRLPYFFIFSAPVFAAGAFLLSFTGVGPYLPLVIYPFYALAVSAWSVFLGGILYRSGGYGTPLLVAFFYDFAFFALALWSLSVIVYLQIFGFELPFGGAIPRAIVAGAAVATAAAVGTVMAANRRGLMDVRIHAWPWRDRAKEKS